MNTDKQFIYLVHAKENNKTSYSEDIFIPFFQEEKAKAFVRRTLNEYIHKYLQANYIKNKKLPDYASASLPASYPVDLEAYRASGETQWSCREYSPECRPIKGVFAAQLFTIDVSKIN